MSRERVLSLAAMDKLLRVAGAPRVSDGAKESLADELERVGKDLGVAAVTFSQHAGRRTVTAADIRLASMKK